MSANLDKGEGLSGGYGCEAYTFPLAMVPQLNSFAHQSEFINTFSYL